MDMTGVRTEVDPLSSRMSLEECCKQERPEVIQSRGITVVS